MKNTLMFADFDLYPKYNRFCYNWRGRIDAFPFCIWIERERELERKRENLFEWGRYRHNFTGKEGEEWNQNQRILANQQGRRRLGGVEGGNNPPPEDLREGYYPALNFTLCLLGMILAFFKYIFEFWEWYLLKTLKPFKSISFT